mmetsp:Transcript_9972/g.21957  ORF Transcript_9972/g.21957 Transcript_9972/m.21957 type:complete len:295 (+) Transcript_9972:637-1521(+)
MLLRLLECCVRCVPLLLNLVCPLPSLLSQLGFRDSNSIIQAIEVVLVVPSHRLFLQTEMLIQISLLFGDDLVQRQLIGKQSLESSLLLLPGCLDLSDHLIYSPPVLCRGSLDLLLQLRYPGLNLDPGSLGGLLQIRGRCSPLLGETRLLLQLLLLGLRPLGAQNSSLRLVVRRDLAFLSSFQTFHDLLLLSLGKSHSHLLPDLLQLCCLRLILFLQCRKPPRYVLLHGGQLLLAGCPGFLCLLGSLGSLIQLHSLLFQRLLRRQQRSPVRCVCVHQLSAHSQHFPMSFHKLGCA